MNIETLKERIEKVKIKIEKKQKTIEKKTIVVISKKKENWEIEWLKQDISRLNKEIQESTKTLEKYELQLAGEIERESIFTKEIPEVMKELQKELEEKWIKYDLNRQERLMKAYDSLTFSEFIKKYNRSSYDFMIQEEEKIIEDNKKAAKAFVLDLYIRVREITGEVVSWDDIHYSAGVLNGVVIGKEGKAKVESILAGGWNIQRLHIRVLVHSI